MDDRTAARITISLRGLGRVNAYEFCSSPALRRSYLWALKNKRIVYVPDQVTCGLPDCWSTWRGLVERYGERGEKPEAARFGGRIPLDCEDIAGAHAGFMSATGTSGVYMGLVPGSQISHAICGVRDKLGFIHPMDPAVWVGMGDFGRPYRPIYWAEV